MNFSAGRETAKGASSLLFDERDGNEIKPYFQADYFNDDEADASRKTMDIEGNPDEISGLTELTSKKFNFFQNMMKDSFFAKQCMEGYYPSPGVSVGKG
jgi:hypothetical protein